MHAFGLLGDEHVGVEELADDLDEELEGVIRGRRTAPFGNNDDGLGGGRPG